MQFFMFYFPSSVLSHFLIYAFRNTKYTAFIYIYICVCVCMCVSSIFLRKIPVFFGPLSHIPGHLLIILLSFALLNIVWF
jgi:hypothetical protein